MTKVIFYLHGAGGNVLDTTCLLLKKLWHKKETAYVYTADANTADVLDEALWVFKPEAFVPHALHKEGCQADEQTPVYIGNEMPAEGVSTVLVNLSNETVAGWQKFGGIYEMISADEQAVVQGRARYQQYSEADCVMSHHRINHIRSHYFRVGSVARTAETLS